MYVPKNREVKTKKDVIDVIRYCILHHNDIFSIEEVEEEVESYLKFSSFGKYGLLRHTINVSNQIKMAMRGMIRKKYVKKERDNLYRVLVGFDKLFK